MRFSLTTNATLIDSNTAKDLAKDKINVHVSIDGPEEIHNQCRVDKRNFGSFQRTLNGLRYLFDAYGDESKRITLSMVYSPPYTIERVERVAALWDIFSWLPKEIGLNITYAQSFTPPGVDLTDNPDGSLFLWARNRYVEDYRNDRPTHPISFNLINKELVGIVKRREYSSPVESYFLNGCCVPGVRKQFVSVDGTLLPCERIESKCSIGNIREGVDIDIIKNIYVKEYSEKSIEECSKCWALQLCSICYVHALFDSGFDEYIKGRNCILMRRRALDFLKLFCDLMDINKSGLDFLATWKVS